MFQIKGPILAAMDLDKGSEELLRQAEALRVHTRLNFLSVMSFRKFLQCGPCFLNCILMTR